MSSEYVIHLDREPVAKWVKDFHVGKSSAFTVVSLDLGGTMVKLFMLPNKRAELAALFRELADSLDPWDSSCPCYQAGYEVERHPLGA